ncbi:MAG: hypothetical protein ACLFPL_05710 [Candidatus Nanoarchaeia archaeon]
MTQNHSSTQETLLLNTHAQKVIQKLHSLLFKHTHHSQSKHYFTSHLSPTLNNDEILRRQHLLKDIFSTPLPQLQSLKTITQPSNSVQIPYTFYTCDNSIYSQFYEHIAIHHLSQKELQEIEHTGDYDSTHFLITDEFYTGEIQQLSSKELLQFIQGYKNTLNIDTISTLNTNLQLISKNTQQLISELFNFDSSFDWDTQLIEQHTTTTLKEQFNDKIEFIKSLHQKVQQKNVELREIVKNQQVNLQGDELIELLQSNNYEHLQKKLQQVTQEMINSFENQLQEELKAHNFSKQILFSQKHYPLELDEDVESQLYREVEQMESKAFIDFYISFSTPTTQDIKQAIDIVLCTDMLASIQTFYEHNSAQDELIFPTISQSLQHERVSNPLLERATPISYALKSKSIIGAPLNNESVSILTGANSGGKTTLLELLLTSQYLFSCGLPLKGDVIKLPIIEEIVYLKKFSGTQGAGAFEQTIKELLKIISTESTKLLLIDEFEAITEPGAAATILTHFLQEVSKHSIYCVAVSHLGEDIQTYIQNNNITSIRIDGISAKGLDEKGKLLTNHQPEFNSFGKSTPELILQRVQNDTKFFSSLNDNAKELLQTIIQSTKK